jgi:hypothetical protein
MMESAAQFPAQSLSADGVEALLRVELASGDAAALNVAPILRHLIDNGANAMFSDAIIAGVRGMVCDLTRQLLDAQLRVKGETERIDHPTDNVAVLADALSANAALLGHLHALAFEWQLTRQMQARMALDPVLSPLLQAQMASADSQTASLAMRLLAAQARFCQEQQRMQLSLTELPGDLLHSVLVAMRTLAGVEADAEAAGAESVIRLEYHEARTRLGLASRLIAGMGGGGLAALSFSIGHGIGAGPRSGRYVN